MARATAEEIELAEVEFRFFDPPEPGAHAQLAVVVRSRAEASSDPIAVGIPSRWFGSFDVVGAIPEVLADRVGDGGYRYFDFPGLAPGAEATLELHVTATGEDVDPPEISVGLVGAGGIGQARPRTIAPRPRPGPASVVIVPSLDLRAPVVQTVWEPPPFVVGQILGTANVSAGNTVLIGHLQGPDGNVFARLNRVGLGDEVVAVSRGLEYRFVVSEITVLPNVDSRPVLATPTPRLTLMTCIGAWNPFTQDYSDRLWGVAEPPELARATSAANAERAARQAEAAATATAAAAPTAQAAVEATVEATVEAAAAEAEPEPTATPPVAPTPRRADAAPGVPAPTATPPPSPPTPNAAGSVSRPVAVPGRSLPEPAGLAISAPSAQSRVPPRFSVRGTRARTEGPAVHIWLFVRAEVEGGRWYPYPREIVASRDGSWEAEIELGGPPDVRHELRVGVAGPEVNAELARYVAERPGEPLEILPEGFRAEAQRVVIRR